MRPERITVSLTQAHWEALITAAHLGGWPGAREMGMTAHDSDRIVDAAMREVRNLLDTWTTQQKEEGP